MKNNKKGISLIVLIVTIIVIIILAAAVILTLNNNNSIEESNDARYSSDLDNLQSVFTMVVSKIMVEKQAVVEFKNVQIISDDATVEFSLADSFDRVTSGQIIFGKGTNTGSVYYTEKELPNYSSWDTTWVVDTDGNLYLQVGNRIYPKGTEKLPDETND